MGFAQEGNLDILVRHPKYWFNDGSIIFRVQNDFFKVHRTLLSCHSSFFAQCQMKDTIDTTSSSDRDPNVHIVVDPGGRVLSRDVEVLLEHLYHDV